MPRRRAKAFFDRYAHDLTPRDFQRVFTRDTPEAYRYFARGIDTDKLALLPWYRRWPIHARLVFVASAISLFQSRLAHAGYTARPVLAWPDSPAADAVLPR